MSTGHQNVGSIPLKKKKERKEIATVSHWLPHYQAYVGYVWY